MKRVRLWGPILGAMILGSVPGLTATAEGQPVSIEERGKGAARIVVATVAETTARYERNDFGDEVIVTYARLAVGETVKGPAGPVTLAIEGGTVDGITMRVSSLPSLTKGERAVFFLTPGRDGEFRPHLRGQGILKLDQNDRVPGSSLTLDDIRRLAKSNPN